MPQAFDDGPRFSWLVCFLSVVKFRGYAAAAKRIGAAQPTVSRRVERLEEWIGQDLLTKNRPPELTEFGKKHVEEIRMFTRMMIRLKKSDMSFTRFPYKTVDDEDKLFIELFANEEEAIINAGVMEIENALPKGVSAFL